MLGRLCLVSSAISFGNELGVNGMECLGMWAFQRGLVCACMCMCVHVSVSPAYTGRKNVSDTLELELQAAVSYLMGKPGTEPWSFVRAQLSHPSNLWPGLELPLILLV